MPIEPDQLIPFLKSCKEVGLPRIDVMIEAKMKDLALFRIAEQLGKIRGVKRVDNGVLT